MSWPAARCRWPAAIASRASWCPSTGWPNGCKRCWARSIRSCSTAPLRTWPTNTRSFDDRAELIEYLKAGRGFAVTAWCGSPECEAAIKAETSATLRCLTLEPEDPGALCPVCGRPGVETATWGQAY